MNCNNVCGVSQRIGYIDIFRGIAIILMIMGHIGFTFYFDKYIHVFHMPLWFFISGWFFKDTNQKFIFIIKKKSKTLLIPYLFFGIVQYPIWIIFNYKNSKNLLEPLINFLWINTNLVMPIAGALWFLTCLFFTEVFFLVLRRNIRSEKLLFIIILIISTFGTFFNKIFSFRLPWGIDTAFVTIGFYYGGYKLKKFNIKKKWNRLFDIPTITLILCFIINLFMSFINGYVNLRIGTYGFFLLFWFNAFFAIIIYFNISYKLDLFKNNFVIHIINHIKYIGKNSIVYLCLNQLNILVLSKIINFSNYGIFFWFIGQLCVLIVSLLSLFMISKTINRSKLKFFIGK
ncbi:acyltransferase family protein [Clostridium perfringens]|uniref:acyltransferase family protein n=1 Tax=Clostridium perfringens TaxID=1502 RepID=UPI0039E8FA98